MSIKTCLFDFDGTLVDSMPTYVAAMVRLLDEHHVVYGDDLVKTITPLGLLGAARYFQSIGLDMTVEEQILAMKKHMLEAYLYHIPAKNNVVRVLRELQGKVELNVLTASPHVTLDACLKRLGIFDCFANVWSCDDFATTKSDPEIYRMAAQRLGMLPDEILFLDDNLDADKTAKQAGLKVCGVYDDASRDYIDQMKAAADAFIDDFSQLPDVLKSL